MIRLTKKFNFETAHALFGYDGKCRNIHGHSYHLEVTVIGTPQKGKNNPKRGMVMDFSELKKIVNDLIVNKLDHSILLEKGSPNESLGKHLEKEGHQVILTNFTPTCENLLYHFADILGKALPQNVHLQRLKLNETNNSYCEWLREDQLK